MIPFHWHDATQHFSHCQLSNACVREWQLWMRDCEIAGIIAYARPNDKLKTCMDKCWMSMHLCIGDYVRSGVHWRRTHLSSNNKIVVWMMTMICTLSQPQFCLWHYCNTYTPMRHIHPVYTRIVAYCWKAEKRTRALIYRHTNAHIWLTRIMKTYAGLLINPVLSLSLFARDFPALSAVRALK